MGIKDVGPYWVVSSGSSKASGPYTSRPQAEEACNYAPGTAIVVQRLTAALAIKLRPIK